MLKSIHLENFRKHTDLTINFTLGVNCFRAQNEQGKSTVIEAITYALFGSKGLKDSLEEVVTIGTADSKLKVKLDLEFSGVDYTVTRSKSGAELTFGKDIVTGQTVVTKFFEQLLGCSADLATKLMVAEQSSLRGALTDGPTAAGKMIEDLANFDLIDKIVELVQTELVSGNTAAVEARKNLHAEQSADVELTDTVILTTTWSVACTDLATLEGQAENLRVSMPTPEDMSKAYRTLAGTKQVEDEIAQLDRKIGVAETMAGLELPEAPSEAEIAALRVSAEQAKQFSQLTAQKAALAKLDTSPAWDGNLNTLQAEINSVSAESAKNLAEINARKLDLVRAKAMMITETSCAFCKKDLTDVPEVVQVNDKLTAEIRAIQASLDALSVAQKERTEYMEELGRVRHNEAVNLLAFARTADNITLDHTNVPTTYVWDTVLVAPEGAADSLATAERQYKARVLAEAKLSVDTLTLARLREEAGQLAAKALALPPVQPALDLLKAEEVIRLEMINLQVLLNTQTALVNQYRSAIDVASARNVQLVAAQTAAKVSLEAAIAELAEMQSNNALIKKLRVARPQITDKLWSIVLAAVSTYFTEVRGFKSVVTRENNAFCVNGVVIGGGGLSGSAKDALGLAIRIALTKMFLPNISFLILDEMGAACDGERETAMLGLVSTSGFAQVILVSHSELCDAYADNIITL